MGMLVVSVSYQIYHYEAVSNQLKDVGGGGGGGVGEKIKVFIFCGVKT